MKIFKYFYNNLNQEGFLEQVSTSLDIKKYNIQTSKNLCFRNISKLIEIHFQINFNWLLKKMPKINEIYLPTSPN